MNPSLRKPAQEKPRQVNSYLIILLLLSDKDLKTSNEGWDPRVNFRREDVHLFELGRHGRVFEKEQQIQNFQIEKMVLEAH